jgi:hypothetical protein
MTNTKRSSISLMRAMHKKPHQAKPLFDFLDSYDARLLAVYQQKQGSSVSEPPRELRTYLVNARIVIASVTPDGWDLYIPASDQNDTKTTLEAAERFLGARPGEETV